MLPASSVQIGAVTTRAKRVDALSPGDTHLARRNSVVDIMITAACRHLQVGGIRTQNPSTSRFQHDYHFAMRLRPRGQMPAVQMAYISAVGRFGFALPRVQDAQAKVPPHTQRFAATIASWRPVCFLQPAAAADLPVPHRWASRHSTFRGAAEQECAHRRPRAARV